LGIGDVLASIPDLEVYWDMQELSGTTALARDANGLAPTLDGTYSNVTLNQAGAGNVPRLAVFNGTTSYLDIYSAALNGVFDASAGTLLIAGKVSGAGVWTDGAEHQLIHIGDTANNNLVLIRKTATNNQLQWLYRANGTTQSHSTTTSTTSLFLVAISWDTTADETNAWLNTTLVNSPQTGLGVWNGNLEAGSNNIGAFVNTPTFVWDGGLSYGALYTRALTQAEITQICQALGIC
jgi:hypothetical protein